MVWGSGRPLGAEAGGRAGPWASRVRLRWRAAGQGGGAGPHRRALCVRRQGRPRPGPGQQLAGSGLPPLARPPLPALGRLVFVDSSKAPSRAFPSHCPCLLSEPGSCQGVSVCVPGGLGHSAPSIPCLHVPMLQARPPSDQGLPLTHPVAFAHAAQLLEGSAYSPSRCCSPLSLSLDVDSPGRPLLAPLPTAVTSEPLALAPVGLVFVSVRPMREACGPSVRYAQRKAQCQPLCT